jgi:hypothetical protein
MVGFGEYDPASLQGADETELVSRSVARMAHSDVGFGETDPAATVTTDVDEAPHHEMMSMVADGAHEVNRGNGMRGTCMKAAVDHRKC